MPRTLTHEDFRKDEHLMRSDGILFDWDNWGYPIAYYPANAYGTWTYASDDPGSNPGDVFTIDRLPDGEPMIRDHSGDVLCGGCATKFLEGNEDAVVTAAFQINGEVGDCDDVICDDCGEMIYEAPRGTGCPEVCEGDEVSG